jgi:hypothetical protein
MELNHLVLSAKKLEPSDRTSDRDRVRHNLARTPSTTDSISSFSCRYCIQYIG